MALSATELSALAVAPIRPDKPEGDPVTYEPEYEIIKGEIAKIDSLTGETPSWGEIETQSIAILKSKSKDLTVASYLLLSLFQKDGYKGLQAGLTLYNEMITAFWDTLYPELKRMRGRVGAVTWVNERLSTAISRKGATSSDSEATKASLELFTRLSALVDEKFGQDAPSLGDLRRALEEAGRDATPRQAPAAPAAGASAAGAAVVVDSPDAVFKVLRSVGAEVRKVVDYLVKNDPGSPVPYLASRGTAWASIKELPQNVDGVTQFPAPDGNVARNWENLVAGGQWQPLLQDTEWRILVTPLWFDVNYHVALALENLGHDQARAAMVDQCTAFVRRFPDLLRLQYQNGEPFASDAARGWITAELAAIAGSGGGDGEPAPVDPFVEGSREVRSLAARKKLVEAVKLVQQKIEETPGPRDRFRWRLLQASVCMDAGQTALAAVQLNALDREIETHGLEMWEPGLAIEVLQSLYQCEKKLSQNGNRDAREISQRMDRLYERLCRIDIVSALALEGKK